MNLAQQLGYVPPDGCPSFLVPDVEIPPRTVEALVVKKTGSLWEGHCAAWDLHVVRMKAGIPGAEDDFHRRPILQPHLL